MPTVDFEEIFEKAEVGIALNDPVNGTVGLVNDRYAELMGYDRDELQEMQIEEISADDPSFDQTAAMVKIEQALEGHRQQFDWLFERNDGSQFWGEVVLKRTHIGEQIRLLAFVRDISARKRYEQDLERQNARLNEFTSVVSHDLRNPLNVIKGRVELAREECESEHLSAIAGAADRMHDLIEDLLRLAREGEEIGDLEPVDSDKIAAICWENVETESATLNVKTGRAIRADRSQIQQLLENLFRNAVEHAGPEVTISVGELESGNGFYVADNGLGIAAEDREKVFEPGYTRANDGTGFGLSIVRKIADGHGWEIHLVESSEGGARFEFHDVQME